VIAALLVAALAQASAAGAGRCGTCHPDVGVLFEGDVHRAERVGCADCHGGDSTTLVVERAHAGRFTARPPRREAPALCAACHSDIERMRPYNLPTDQLALYRISGHGRRLEKGDGRVAVCTDCHGVHDIRPSDDPASRTSRRNVAATCGRCHDEGEYLGSVHGRALLERGNLRAPDCTRCHGVHGAAPPGVGDVARVCGGCHEPSRRHFLEGPHSTAMAAAGLPECAACHDHHAIEPARLDLLETACARCHDAGGPQVDLGRKMKALLAGAQGRIEEAALLVAQAQEVPIDVGDYEARIEEARTYLREALPAVHAASLERLERLVRRSDGVSREVGLEVHEKLRGLRTRRLGLAVFWFYVLLTVAVLAGFRRRWRQEGPP
jgi:predicted CXXCH cytochrome family protein